MNSREQEASIGDEENRSVVADEVGDNFGTHGPDRMLCCSLLLNSDETLGLELPENVVVFSRNRIDNTDIMELLTGVKESDKSQISLKVPPFCPGEGLWNFLVDLKAVDMRDLSFDEHGKWNRPSSRKYSFERQDDQLRYLGVDLKDRSKEDIYLHKNRYQHPGGDVVKEIYTGRTSRAVMNGNFALITYHCKCDPKSLVSSAHGNSASSRAFQRVKPSTRDLLKQHLPSHSPKEAFRAVSLQMGGASCSTPTELPRNYRQVRDFAAKNELSKRKTASGRPAGTNFEELRKQQQIPGSFVLDYSTGPAVAFGQSITERAFLADQRGIEVFKHFCLNDSVVKRPVLIDMTYNCCRGLYLTAVHTRHPNFERIQTRNSEKNPIIPVCFLLSSHRGQDDYAYLAKMLVQKAELSENDVVFAWVTDGEKALVSGFESQPQFSSIQTTHIRCELHLRENVKRRLRGIADNEREHILQQIFGSEISLADKRVRITGLVDAVSQEEFNLKLLEKKTTWDSKIGGFHQWFTNNIADTIIGCYILAKRLKLSTNGRITTNSCETLNGMIQSELDGRSLPINQVTRRLEKFVSGEFDRLQLALFGSGDFRLVGQWKKYEKSALQWAMMAEVEKHQLLAALNLHSGFVKSHSLQLSVDLETETQITAIPIKDLRNIQLKALAICQNGPNSIVPCPSNTFIVQIWDREKSFRLEKSARSGEYKCCCTEFRAYKYVCGHTVAAAQLEDCLFDHVANISQQLEEETLSKVVDERRAPSAGQKPGSRRRGFASSAVDQSRLVDVTIQQRGNAKLVSLSRTLGIQQPTEQQLQSIAFAHNTVFTQKYHNDKHFQLVRLVDFRKRFKTSTCKCCKIGWPAKVTSPNDFAVVHWERFITHRLGGPTDEYSRDGNLRPALLHPWYQCITTRYAYFTVDYLKLGPDFDLDKQQEQILEEQFGTAIPESTAASWESPH